MITVWVVVLVIVIIAVAVGAYIIYNQRTKVSSAVGVVFPLLMIQAHTCSTNDLATTILSTRDH